MGKNFVKEKKGRKVASGLGPGAVVIFKPLSC